MDKRRVATHTLSGQEEKKNEYRLVSAQCFESASRSKNSPMGMPHNLLHASAQPRLHRTIMADREAPLNR